MGEGSMAEEDETREEAVKVPVSAGPCSLLAWPLGNLAALITGVPNLPANTQFRPPPAKPFGDLIDHLRTCLGSIRSFLFAYVIVFYIHGDDYPAFGAATTLSWSWMCPLLVRNILSAWAVCGFWDWLMYLSPLAARFKPFKIYPKLPTWSQVRHDAFWTTIGMVWILFMTHLREPHDYVRHRLLHPWRLNWFPGPDPGRFLYKHIHKLHHKSYNTTAFSGTSFHPIENTIFLSAGFLAVPFAVHPVIFVALMVDCGFAAWLGHGGFVFP